MEGKGIGEERFVTDLNTLVDGRYEDSSHALLQQSRRQDDACRVTEWPWHCSASMARQQTESAAAHNQNARGNEQQLAVLPCIAPWCAGGCVA